MDRGFVCIEYGFGVHSEAIPRCLTRERSCVLGLSAVLGTDRVDRMLPLRTRAESSVQVAQPE